MPNRRKVTQRDDLNIKLLSALCLLEKQGIFSDTCLVNKRMQNINKSDVCIEQDSRKKEMIAFLKKAIRQLKKTAKKERKKNRRKKNQKADNGREGRGNRRKTTVKSGITNQKPKERMRKGQ